MQLVDYLDKGARAHPDAPCLTMGAQTLTYAEVQERSHQVAELGVNVDSVAAQEVVLVGVIAAGDDVVPRVRDKARASVVVPDFGKPRLTTRIVILPVPVVPATRLRPAALQGPSEAGRPGRARTVRATACPFAPCAI